MIKTAVNSISAGILIAIGGSVYLACDNKYAGAALFSVALLCICYLGYYLFTGKIGYLATDRSKKNALSLALGLAVNLAVTFLLGMLIRFAMPALGEKAAALCGAKLGQSFIGTFIRAVFCGVLMYLAVHIFKEKKTPIGIIFCIPVFILSGFEHSIADMFYFGVSGIFSIKVLSFELAAVLGNSVGSLILPLLAMLGQNGQGGGVISASGKSKGNPPAAHLIRLAEKANSH